MYISLLFGIYFLLERRKPLAKITNIDCFDKEVPFPFLVLLISGGHCLIAVAEAVNKFLLLGKTLDDAPGEAFDKIARRLKIWNMDGFDRMSGGKAMEFLSQSGDPKMFPIAEPLLHSNDCYFSFAGIKNSARQFILEEEEKHGMQGGEVLPNVADICASVQFAIIKHLCRRLQRAMTFVEQQTLIPKDHQALVISGGVASNGAIRSAISMLCKEMEYSLHVPPPYLCTDNGIMIAWNGVEKWAAGIDVIPYNQVDNIDFQAKAPLGSNICDEVGRSGIKCRWVKSIFSRNAKLSSPL